jgi:hypothetical protein
MRRFIIVGLSQQGLFSYVYFLSNTDTPYCMTFGHTFTQIRDSELYSRETNAVIESVYDVFGNPRRRSSHAMHHQGR